MRKPCERTRARVERGTRESARVGMIAVRHAEGKRGEHHYCVDARLECASAVKAGTSGKSGKSAGASGARGTPNARLGAVRCDVRGAKDEYARARAVAVASEAQMTAIFARGVSDAVRRTGTAANKRGRRRTASCVAKRRNERTGCDYWVVIACDERDDASAVRTMSFRCGAGEAGGDEAKTRAVEFTTSAAFDAWVAGSKCVPGSKKEGLGGSRIRAKKHPYAYSGIMGDDVIDCACGDNEEYGFMVACETCGVWEHGECCRIQSEEAIPKDYACSTCVRRNEKTVAVLEFSSAEKNGSARTAPTPVRSPEGDEIKDDSFGTIAGVARELQENGIVVCCVCGCEDCDGDYGAMIRACECRGGGAVAHASCMKNWASKQSTQKSSNARSRGSGRASPVAQCRTCGDFGGKASGVMEPAKVGDMLNAMKKAVEDLSTTYEADAMAYRSNPRPRTPLAECNAKKEPEIEAKPKLEKKKPAVAKPLPADTQIPPKSEVKREKFAGTPVSMLPLKKRRMMAWDSEQKLVQARASSENVLVNGRRS